MPATSRRVLLRHRPEGEPRPTDFEIVEGPVPRPGEGEVLTRTIYLSLDPYMRGRMNPGRSYAPSVELGGVMVGGTVGEVVESRNPAFAAGDLVVGYDGWQTHAVSSGAGLRKLELRKPPSIAETLDWARGLLALGVRELDAPVVRQTLALVLKHEDDVRKADAKVGALVSSRAAR